MISDVDQGQMGDVTARCEVSAHFAGLQAGLNENI